MSCYPRLVCLVKPDGTRDFALIGNHFRDIRINATIHSVTTATSTALGILDMQIPATHIERVTRLAVRAVVLALLVKQIEVLQLLNLATHSTTLVTSLGLWLARIDAHDSVFLCVLKGTRCDKRAITSFTSES